MCHLPKMLQLLLHIFVAFPAALLYVCQAIIPDVLVRVFLVCSNIQWSERNLLVRQRKKVTMGCYSSVG